VTRVFQQRLHQREFRERVVRAYQHHCSICRLRRNELLVRPLTSCLTPIQEASPPFRTAWRFVDCIMPPSTLISSEFAPTTSWKCGGMSWMRRMVRC
jgi:hypothetical protein